MNKKKKFVDECLWDRLKEITFNLFVRQVPIQFVRIMLCQPIRFHSYPFSFNFIPTWKKKIENLLIHLSTESFIRMLNLWFHWNSMFYWFFFRIGIFFRIFKFYSAFTKVLLISDKEIFNFSFFSRWIHLEKFLKSIQVNIFLF